MGKKDNGEPVGCDVFMENASRSPHEAGRRSVSGRDIRGKKGIPKGARALSLEEVRTIMFSGSVATDNLGSLPGDNKGGT